MTAPKTLPGFGLWKGLLTIGVAMLSCVRDGKETAEIRYFISSLSRGVKRFAHAVRSHWGIENTCHGSLDITYREDESRIRDLHLRENFAWLNRFTLSLLKQHPTKDSLAMKRRNCGWDDKLMPTFKPSEASASGAFTPTDSHRIRWFASPRPMKSATGDGNGGR